MTTNIIAGILLILFGLSILLKTLFGIDLPIFRFLLAGALIYAGISLLSASKKSCSTQKKSIFFSDGTIKLSHIDPSCIAIGFGKGIIDCSTVRADSIPLTISITCGAGVLKINKDTPVKIIINTCLANVDLPTNDTVALGSYTYFSHDQMIKPMLIIDATVVLGSLTIVQV
jgi:hypothetical protein